MKFSAKGQNFCIENHLYQYQYKYKISKRKPSGNNFFVISCWKIFVGPFCSFSDSIEMELFEYSGHGRLTDIAQVLANVFSLHPKDHVLAPADCLQYLEITFFKKLKPR